MDMHDSAWAVPKPPKRIRTPKRHSTGNVYKDRSIQQEDRLAVEMTNTTGIPFERVFQSGANKTNPGDIRTSARTRLPSHKWLIELKLIGKMSTGRNAQKVMSIAWDWLVQIIKEANQEHSLPALLYGYPGETQEFVILRKEDFQTLLSEHHTMSEIIDR